MYKHCYVYNIAPYNFALYPIKEVSTDLTHPLKSPLQLTFLIESYAHINAQRITKTANYATYPGLEQGLIADMLAMA